MYMYVDRQTDRHTARENKRARERKQDKERNEERDNFRHSSNKAALTYFQNPLFLWGSVAQRQSAICQEEI